MILLYLWCLLKESNALIAWETSRSEGKSKINIAAWLVISWCSWMTNKVIFQYYIRKQDGSKEIVESILVNLKDYDLKEDDLNE